MSRHFTKHYTLEEARTLLPKVRKWLEQLRNLRTEVREQEERMTTMMTEGNDLGGAKVNSWIKNLAALREIFLEFHEREIQIKDPERGLIDFPSIIGGKEVFLCWEDGEETIEFWHDLDAGYAGREKL